MLLNEHFRVYRIIIWDKDGGHRTLKKRTKDEAKSALTHYIDSWTTKAITVVNTKTYEGRTWVARRKGDK